MPHRALILDDEADILELIDLTFSRMDIQCTLAETLAEAYDFLDKNEYDLCITDMRLPDGSGMELLHRLQKSYPELPVAVITAFGSADLAVESLKAGAFDFISKPLDLVRLRKLATNTLKLKNERLETTSTDRLLLGDSHAIKHVKKMIRKLSRSEAPVHISGESGTGKELVARSIHQLGPRAEGPFIPVNCGAIPGELMESEFFGHKKGSFTGATQNKQGLFHAAQGGTLFLDEVAELPPPMQVKLLRAIQERAIRRVGEHDEQPMDVRILSATNKDLAALVKKQEFRDDLYYRLNVINLPIPPLRERHGDIPLLTHHFIGRLKNSHGTDIEVTEPAIQKLEEYHYPGNIRELENILEGATAICEDYTIQAHDLNLTSPPLQTTDRPAKADDRPERSVQITARGEQALSDYLEQIERSEITSVLEQTQWNRGRAARILKITQRQLRYRMTKLGIQG